MFEEAKSEALRVLEVFEELGAADDVETTEWFLGKAEEMDNLVASHGSGNDGKLFETIQFAVFTHFMFCRDHRIRAM